MIKGKGGVLMKRGAADQTYAKNGRSLKLRTYVFCRKLYV